MPDFDTDARTLELMAEALVEPLDEVAELHDVPVGAVQVYCLVVVNGRPLGVAAQEDDPMMVADALGNAASAILHACANGGDERARTRIRRVILERGAGPMSTEN